jgi:hypothetical protein
MMEVGGHFHAPVFSPGENIPLLKRIQKDTLLLGSEPEPFTSLTDPSWTVLLPVLCNSMTAVVYLIPGSETCAATFVIHETDQISEIAMLSVL